VIVGIVLVFVAGPVLLLTPFIAWHYRLSNKRREHAVQWNRFPEREVQRDRAPAFRL
jgi:hypothetical protein